MLIYCGNLEQVDALVTLTTSQAPVTPGPRTELRASRTIESIACSWGTAVFRELRVQCVNTANNLLMWGRYPHIDTFPHIGDPDVIALPTLQPRHCQQLSIWYHRTTLLPDLHRQLQWKRTQLTSTSEPDITTTGRTFITDQSSKRRFLNDTGSFTMTTARLMVLSSSLTDDCLLASIWGDAGTTRQATAHRRTLATNF
jgi:hypothetical protein